VYRRILETGNSNIISQCNVLQSTIQQQSCYMRAGFQFPQRYCYPAVDASVLVC
jgi:hypothetical protein